MNTATCLTCEISPLLRFHFWKPTYFNLDDSDFPSDSTEETGRFVGISENSAHRMTFSNLNTTTNIAISRYNSRPAGQPISPNLRTDPLTTHEVIKSRHLPSTNLENNEEPRVANKEALPTDSNSSPKQTMPIIAPSGLVGMTFLISQEDIQRLRARIVKVLDEYDGDLQRDSSRIKFICCTKDDTVEDVFIYNKILYCINKSEDNDRI